ncbi:MAG TPA: ATP-binding protein [Sporichthyaceae bacterium]|jgi:anti-sigma regulatory factor (Ser/Thr protein kinase)
MHTVTDVRPPGAAGSVGGTLALPHSHASVRLARARLATDLLSRDLPARVVQDALLVLTEILTNAIRHAPPLPSGLVRMSWELCADSVRIEITDGGSPEWLGQALASGGPGKVPRRASLAPGGRGMLIIDALCPEWGIRPSTEGKTVWAGVPARTDQPAAKAG